MAETPIDLDIALPAKVAQLLHTTDDGLAQMRYRGTGPKFVKVGKKVLYRWSDIRAYLDANTCQRTDDARGPAFDHPEPNKAKRMNGAIMSRPARAPAGQRTADPRGAVV